MSEGMVDRYRGLERELKSLIRSELSSGKPPKKKGRVGNNDGDVRNMSWREVLSVTPWSLSSDSRVICVNSSVKGKCLSPRPHKCTSVSGAKVYRLSAEGSPEGLHIIQGALCATEQLYWSRRSSENYSTAEWSNLSALALKKSSTVSATPLDDYASTMLKSTSNDNEVDRDLWKKSLVQNDNFNLFKKLRWVCLGYHYDWTERCYGETAWTEFPTELASVCESIATSAGENLRAEAAIVNYYPQGSTMGGHVDDSEHTLAAPIVSVSLGRGAIFLIGGQSREIRPVPILVRSGDAVVMSGESRVCYHGVAAILSRELEDRLTSMPIESTIPLSESPVSLLSTKENEQKVHDTIESVFAAESESLTLEDRESAAATIAYLQDNRINFNVRQVKRDINDPWLDKRGKSCSAKILLATDLPAAVTASNSSETTTPLVSVPETNE